MNIKYVFDTNFWELCFLFSSINTSAVLLTVALH